MKINRYELKNLSKEEKETLFNRANKDIENTERLVKPILKDIKENGLESVIKYSYKFDNVQLNAENIKVTENEFLNAKKKLDPLIFQAIKKSSKNIETFHQAQMPNKIWLTEIEEGVLSGEKITPIPSLGIYVPRGKGSFAQIVLRLGIPAKVAGVKNIIICTPPMKDGTIDPATLVAANYIGIKNIFKIGGSQAIASMAYGIEGILPKVDKIVGPGNEYVVAAKSLLHNIIDTGIPAGISESIILADESADPYNATLDWLIEAEHGPDSPALLVTHSKELANQCETILPTLLDELTEDGKNYATTGFSRYGGIVITSNMEESIDFINNYAPEHIELMVQEPMELLEKIVNAGEILLGGYTPISIANFTLGPSSVLPTGGFAKTFSGISVHDFLKRTSLGYVSKSGFKNLKDETYNFAKNSQLMAHAIAISKRKI